MGILLGLHRCGKYDGFQIIGRRKSDQAQMGLVAHQRGQDSESL